jgi:transcriptional regulator with XRE-family HTH domain
MPETTGERIKRLREERRWTQKKLAAKLEVSSKTISNWERGENMPRGSIGALEKVFAETIAGTETDPVEEAIKASPLVDWRQDLVLSAYRRNLREQDADAPLAQSLATIKDATRAKTVEESTGTSP